MILFEYNGTNKHVLPEGTVPFTADFDSVQAAAALLKQIPEDQLRPFFKMPYSDCWFEWTDGRRRWGVWASDTKSDGKMGIVGCVADTLAKPPYRPEEVKTINAVVQWNELTKAFDMAQAKAQLIPMEFHASDQQHMNAFAMIYAIVVLLNCRNLAKTEQADFTKINAARARKGLAPKKSPIRIVLLPKTREYVRHLNNPTYLNEQGETMVRCHPALYHTGVGRKEREVIWRGPYKRGNPEHGSKIPEYIVT